MQRYIALAALGLFSFLAACNTMEGVGQDIEAGGEAVTETADEVQQEL